jgi:hypothetical protein
MSLHRPRGSVSQGLPWSCPRFQHHAAQSPGHRSTGSISGPAHTRKIHVSRLLRFPEPALSSDRRDGLDPISMAQGLSHVAPWVRATMIGCRVHIESAGDPRQTQTQLCRRGRCLDRSDHPARRGRRISEYIRFDNGAEFITHKRRVWIGAVPTKTAFIAPGSPWENGPPHRPDRPAGPCTEIQNGPPDGGTPGCPIDEHHPHRRPSRTKPQ